MKCSSSLEAAATVDCARIAVWDVKSREVVFDSSGHAIAWEIVQRLNSRISRLRVLALSTANRIVAEPARIRELYAAIERNEPVAAAEACRMHVAEARKIAETLLVATS